MMTFEKVLEVFNDYLNKDSVLEVVNTKRGYTVMIWDEKDEQWFGVEHCKAPELYGMPYLMAIVIFRATTYS